MIRIHCLKCDLYFFHHVDTKKHWDEYHDGIGEEYYKLEIVEPLGT
jgi:hypothetical protein